MINFRPRFSKKTFNGVKKRKTFSYYSQKRRFAFISAICLCAVLVPVVVSTALKGNEEFVLQKQEEIRLTHQENPIIEAIRVENIQGKEAGNTADTSNTLKASDIQKASGELTTDTTTDGTAKAKSQTVEGQASGVASSNQPILESVEPTANQTPAAPTAPPAPTAVSGETPNAAPTVDPSTAPSVLETQGTPSADSALNGAEAAASEIPSEVPTPSPNGVGEPQPTQTGNGEIAPTTTPQTNGVQIPLLPGVPLTAEQQAQQQAATDAAAFEAKIAEYVSAGIKPEVTSPLVPAIQTRLMELEYMQEDEPTEFYGPATTNSIKYFQRKHELEVTGITDEATLRLLFSPDAKVYTVFLGAEGIDVEELQKRLAELGYPVSVTGYFGTETQSAVEYFQRMEGLGVDGNVGSYTRERLYSQDAQRSLESPTSSSGGSKGNNGNSSADKIIEIAKKYLGVPYILGAKGPSAFDCSGFIYYVLNESGYDIGYMTSSAWSQSGYETINGMENLRKGDIICFKGHVGFYIGDGIMIDSVPSENGVRISTDIRNSSYWTKNFRYGKRIL